MGVFLLAFDGAEDGVRELGIVVLYAVFDSVDAALLRLKLSAKAAVLEAVIPTEARIVVDVVEYQRMTKVSPGRYFVLEGEELRQGFHTLELHGPSNGTRRRTGVKRSAFGRLSDRQRSYADEVERGVERQRPGNGRSHNKPPAGDSLREFVLHSLSKR